MLTPIWCKGCENSLMRSLKFIAGWLNDLLVCVDAGSRAKHGREAISNATKKSPSALIRTVPFTAISQPSKARVASYPESAVGLLNIEVA